MISLRFNGIVWPLCDNQDNHTYVTLCHSEKSDEVVWGAGQCRMVATTLVSIADELDENLKQEIHWNISQEEISRRSDDIDWSKVPIAGEDGPPEAQPRHQETPQLRTFLSIGMVFQYALDDECNQRVWIRFGSNWPLSLFTAGDCRMAAQVLAVTAKELDERRANNIRERYRAETKANKEMARVYARDALIEKGLERARKEREVSADGNRKSTLG